MSSLTLGLDEHLQRYVVEHGNLIDDILRDLIEETRRELEMLSMMQISPEQGGFMQMLTTISGAKRAVEVGTFTGYSALCVARGLPADGTLLCCDISEDFTAIGRRYWERAGVSDKITLQIGPALDTLQALPESARFDIAFIDADKPAYRGYYEEILKRMDAGGVILIDNVLWSGRVADPDVKDEEDESTAALRALNDFIATDSRVDVTMLPIGDGLTLIRRK